MKTVKLNYPKIAPFEFVINKISFDKQNIIVNDQHIHDSCEIYFNLTGDVSFMVEDTIYPISKGNVIISRPFEAHHCIYNSKTMHKHYWILFSAKGNEPYLDIFFKREKGTENLFILSPASIQVFTEICDEMLKENLSVFEKYSLFFKMLEILNQSKVKSYAVSNIKKEILHSLEFINEHITESISVKALADKVNMSISGFERLFKKETGLTPLKYIKNRRLSIARSLLADGCSVSEAAEKSGFSDCSYFISQFKRVYGITPFKAKST